MESESEAEVENSFLTEDEFQDKAALRQMHEERLRQFQEEEERWEQERRRRKEERRKKKGLNRPKKNQTQTVSFEEEKTVDAVEASTPSRHSTPEHSLSDESETERKLASPEASPILSKEDAETDFSTRSESPSTTDIDDGNNYNSDNNSSKEEYIHTDAEEVEESELENEDEKDHDDKEVDELTAQAESSQDETDDDNINGLTIEQLYDRERMRHAETKERMKQLISSIDSYKDYVENEKQTLEAEVTDAKNAMLAEIETLKERIAELEEENTDFRKQYDEMIAEYENRLEKMEEEKKTRTRENVENLQTLIKELTYIEEANQALGQELETEKEEHAKVVEELSLSKQIIAQLETKLSRQIQALTASNEAAAASNPEEVSELKKNLQEERAKMEHVGKLLLQIQRIALPAVQGGDSALMEKLQQEEVAHDTTKQLLETEKKKVADDKKEIDRLNKRIKDLIQSHSLALKSQQDTPGNRGSLTPDLFTPEEIELDNWRRLLLAIQDGKLDEISKLFNKSKDLIKKTDELGRTALHLAIAQGKLSVVKYLLDHGANPNLTDKNGWNAVHHCAKATAHGASEIFKVLLKRPDLQVAAPNIDKNIPLHYLARNRSLTADVFNAVISKSPINYQNANGETPLHSTCFDEGHEDAAKILLQHNANANVVSSAGETPLHWAARLGSVKLVKLLLEHRADATIEGRKGRAIDVATNEDVKQLLQKAMGGRKKRGTLSVSASSPAVTAREPSHNLQASQSMASVRVDPTKAGSLHPDKRLVLNIKSDFPGIQLTTTVNSDWTVGQVLKLIRKKFPGNTEDYSLFSKSRKLDVDKFIHSYSKVMKHKEVFFGKEAPTSKNDTLRKYATTRVPPRSVSDNPVPRRTKSSVRVKELYKRSLSAPAVDFATIMAHFEGKEQQIILIQSLIRRWICRKRFNKQKDASRAKEQIGKDLVNQHTDYVGILNKLYSSFIKPITISKTAKVAEVSGLKALFEHEDPIRTEAVRTLFALHQQVDKWSMISSLGKPYMAMVQSKILFHYSKYASYYYQALHHLKDKTVVSLLIKNANVPDDVAPVLLEWIAAPVTYIQQVNVKLKDALRLTTPSHPDHQALKSALSEIDKVNDEIVVLAREVENQEKISKIQDSLTGSAPSLNSPGRFFIREGELSVRSGDKDPKWKKRVVILFSDLVLIVQSSTRKFLDQISLNARSTAEESSNVDKKPRFFPFVVKGSISVMFSARTQEERASWLRMLKSVCEDLQEASRTRRMSSVSLDVLSNLATSATPKKMSKKKSSNEVVSLLAQTACAVCYSTFGVTKRKYICKKCGSAVCRNCSTKHPSGILCSSCKRSTERQVGITDLNEKLLFHIFSFLDVYQLGVIFRVCKKWNETGKNASFWQIVYLKTWYKNPSTPVSDWKKKCLVEANWAKKKHTLTYLKGHTASITAVSSSDNFVFSGSIDTYVKVWKVDKQQNISTMKHSHTVRAIEFDKKHSRLMSASDNTVKIWELESNKVLKTKKLHSGEITALQYDADNDILISSSADKTVKITDLKSMKTIKSLSHKDAVSCFRSHRVQLVSGARSVLHVWDLKMLEKPVSLLTPHSDVIRAVALNDSAIISGSDDTTIKISEQQTVHTLRGHSGKVQSLYLDGSKLLSCGTDGSIRIWNTVSLAALNSIMLPSDTGWVRCLHADENKLVSGHGDNIVRVWDFGIKTHLH